MMVPNLRQKECFERSLESLERAAGLIRERGYSELASFEFRSARQQMEIVLGWDGDDELLDRIFSDFCIGK
jgi:tRNA modification GTPase